MEADRALRALLCAPKYRGVYPGAVERVYREALRRHGPKGAEKAARAELHRIAGAFLTPGELKRARSLLADARSGDGGALIRALSLHASTRERLADMEALYARALPALGNPRTVADLACGLNPLYLGSLGLSVRGIELQTDAAALVNDWAAALGWDVSVAPGDLAAVTAEPELPAGPDHPAGPELPAGPGLPVADATLLMKLLPLLDKQLPGGGRALLTRVRSKTALVTFPTRTLSGRDVGMRAHYEQSFEQNLPERSAVLDKFSTSNELCYVLGLHF